MKFSIIILAGGKSSRMGHDKGLLLFKGKPMIQHLIDRFQKIIPEIIIASNNENYKQFNLPVVKDNFLQSGPLSGIEAGLLFSKNEKNIVLSCDSPFVELKTIQHLLSHNLKSDIIFSFYEKAYPFPGLYSKTIQKKLKTIILAGERKVTSLNNYFKVEEVDLSSFNLSNFINFNSIKDINDWDEINR